MTRVVLALALLGGGGWLYSTSECTVGYTGSAASLTVRELGAGETCDSILRQQPGTYRMTSASTRAVICEYTVSTTMPFERRYVVRDEGTLKIMGNAVCSSIAKLPTARR